MPEKKTVVFPAEDIEFALCRGSSYSQSKLRVYEHFQMSKNTADNARYLKEEYGNSGSTITYPSGSRGFVDYDGKGVSLSRHAGTSLFDEKQKLSWTQAAGYIRQSILAGRYLNEKGLAAYHQWKRAKERHAQVMAQVRLDVPESERRIEYAIGDTLYLEDGSGYVVEDIGPQGVLLRDAALPLISRTLPKPELEKLALSIPQNKPYFIGGEDENTALADNMPHWIAACYQWLDKETPAGTDMENPLIRRMMDEKTDRYIEREYPDYMTLARRYRTDADFRRLFRDNAHRALALSRRLQAEQEPKEIAQAPTSPIRVIPDTAEGAFILEADDDVPDEALVDMRRFLEQPDDEPPFFEGQPFEQQGFFTGGYEDMPAPAPPMPDELPVSVPPADEPPKTEAPDFVITDDRLGEGGEAQRFSWNLNAIETLKRLEEQGAQAGEEEQEILSRYVGWGSLPQAFDDKNAKWQQRSEGLKAILDADEYRMARASTLNAHYTAPLVIREMYQVLERMGFSKGNLCDPACGVGNFFGLMPPSMQAVRRYGVELDSITGRLAQQIYPHAHIEVRGFEDMNYTDAFFDVMVGNVPFGSYGVQDSRYDKHKFSIHDYFFAKALDKVRPGGIVAFVTSKYTMDKKDKAVRQYIANRADLLGAVRLPNTAFKANAGTEVTTDILFLQKLDRVTDRDVPWLHLSKTEDGIPVNAYYTEHPEMLLGTMAWDDRMYGSETETTCNPDPGTPFAAQLARACDNITGTYLPAEKERDSENTGDGESIPADSSVRNYSYTLVDERLYFRENSAMHPVKVNKTAEQRIRGLIPLRDCVREIIQLQLDNASDSKVHAKQRTLTALYDAYTKRYGLINSRGNSMAFASDAGYYLLCSLEVLDEEGHFLAKSDLFTKRTIRKSAAISHADTVQEALAISMGERARVDLVYMQSLLATEKSIEEMTAELQGVIYHDPGYDKQDLNGWKMADEYLSGDVRQKLALARQVAQRDPDYRINAQALEQVQPKELDATEIGVRLGARWIPAEYYQQFMCETFDTASWARESIRVLYVNYNDSYSIRNKSSDTSNNVKVNSTFGTKRKNAYQILEDCLNLHATRVYDMVLEADGSKKRVFNKKETILAQQKQETVKQAFKDWIYRDTERRQTLVALYNEIFNSERVREYNGEHIRFVGMNPEKTMQPHQVNAVARGLYGGNTLLAHAVGAGKTYEMVALAMELKRLGLCNKSLVVVPNHLIDQWAGEFLTLYPCANILVSTNRDFETAHRKKFCGRISTGDWDAVIIGHSQFEKIPVSKARQVAMLERQIDDILIDIDMMKAEKAENFTIKQAERTRKSLEARLKRLNDDRRKDEVVTFEELGVDRLFVDEAHFYKNLFMYTKMRNVAGIPQTEAQKSSDLYLKCQYLDEVTGGRGIIFATGTPLSNSMVELYTMMRYLQSALLARKRWAFFDAWASAFGETVTALELAPEGGGYRLKTRFARFYNLPELMTHFREAADIQTSDMLDLNIPELEGGRPIDVVVKASDYQRQQVADFGKRADLVRRGDVDPRDDNMLKITNDGRKLALDQRLFDPAASDDPNSKVNACVERVYREWKDSAAFKGTQLLFCDLSTPKEKPDIIMEEKNGVLEMVDFSYGIYWDVKAKLMARGVPEKEIAFIHDAATDVQKAALFAKVRAGQVRVLLGSTQRMGAGTNVQTRLIALHHLDVPWRPSDIEQREGRMLRQGNDNDVVRVYRYVTEGTFDAYSWGLIESKQKFISQVMSSKSPARFCEDVDDSVLSYAEIKALATGNPKMKEKADLEVEISRLHTLKASYDSELYRLQDSLVSYFPKREVEFRTRMEGLKEDIRRLGEHPLPEDGFLMEVNGVQYGERKKAGAALLAQLQRLKGEQPLEVGSFRSFPMRLSCEKSWLGDTHRLELCGALTHSVNLENDAVGSTMRITNKMQELEKDRSDTGEALKNLLIQRQNAKDEVAKPFPQQEELSRMLHRLAALNTELTLEDAEPADVVMDGDAPDEDMPPPAGETDREKGGDRER